VAVSCVVMRVRNPKAEMTSCAKRMMRNLVRDSRDGIVMVCIPRNRMRCTLHRRKLAQDIDQPPAASSSSLPESLTFISKAGSTGGITAKEAVPTIISSSWSHSFHELTRPTCQKGWGYLHGVRTHLASRISQGSDFCATLRMSCNYNRMLMLLANGSTRDLIADACARTPPDCLSNDSHFLAMYENKQKIHENQLSHHATSKFMRLALQDPAVVARLSCPHLFAMAVGGYETKGYRTRGARLRRRQPHCHMSTCGSLTTWPSWQSPGSPGISRPWWPSSSRVAAEVEILCSRS